MIYDNLLVISEWIWLIKTVVEDNAIECAKKLPIIKVILFDATGGGGGN